jgi:protein MpaA
MNPSRQRGRMKNASENRENAGSRHGRVTSIAGGSADEGRRATSDSCRFLRPAALLVLLVIGGCSTASGVRQRFFGSRTVPTTELGMAPRPAAPAKPQPREPVARFRTKMLGALGRSNDWHPIGRSVDGRPIEALLAGTGPSRVLLIGGIHGDEPEGLPVIERLTDEIISDRTLTRSATILIVRNLNPDGTADRSRTNKNGVDLNRNFPASNWDATARQKRFHPGSQPGSEPETQVLVELMNEFQPERILVMHATQGKPMVNYDGPARELAEAMSQLNGYVTSDTIGYPTPGSLGSYAGVDKQIPIITLELPRGVSFDTAWRANRDALFRFMQ